MSASFQSEIEQFLEPQRRFEALRRDALERSRRGICDLGYANSWDGPSQDVLDVLASCLESKRSLELQYTPYGGGTISRRVVARSLGPDHHWKDVVFTPGAMSALNLVFRELRDHGPVDSQGEVIVITPCWMDVPLYLANLGLKPVLVDVDAKTLHLDLDAIRDALTPNTRALVFCQPANPSGVLYTREELEALAGILQESQARPLWISDECHRDIVLPGHELVSPLDLYDESVSVYSFGKAFALQGQRMGYVAVSPRMPERRALTERYEELCRVMGFCTPTALMQLAVRQLVDLRPSLDFLVDRRARLLAALQDSGYDVVPSDATFFLYPRVPSGDDFTFCESLAARGLLTLPSSLFHHRGHFRLSCTATEAMLERGIEILRDVTRWRTPA